MNAIHTIKSYALPALAALTWAAVAIALFSDYQRHLGPGGTAPPQLRETILIVGPGGRS